MALVINKVYNAKDANGKTITSEYVSRYAMMMVF